MVWVIFREDIRISTIVEGLVVGLGCAYFSDRYFPLKKIRDVNFLRLILYPFYLIGQIYIAAFLVIKMIIVGARVDVVTLDTRLKSDTLRSILGYSINLIPGTILIDLKGDKIPLLWLREQNDSEETAHANETIKGGLEKRLLKAQK